jgi:hypothetical protein
MNKVLRIAVSVVFFLWLLPRWIYSCGPFFSYAVFTYKSHPDFPLKDYAAGAIGIPQPTYARSYLVVAYRYYSGVPLNTREQSAATQLWAFRMDLSWPGANSDDWLKARKLVPGVQSTKVESLKTLPGYEGYMSCPTDAFETAADTLKEHIKHYGASSSEVRDWLAAQEIVFSHCGDAPASPDKIREAAPGAPARLRADRAYQRAAMSFYGGEFDSARQQFETIAADSSSRWSKLAPYLAARAVIRKATLSAPADKNFDASALTDAESMLDRILKNPNLRSIHKKAKLLRGFVEFRLHPERRTHEVAKELLHASAVDSMWEELDDYTRLLDKFLGWSAENGEEEVRQQKELWEKPGVIQRLRQDDLTDWILTFQSESPREHNHAIVRWRTTKSLAWLIAALTHEGASDKSAQELLEGAAEVPPDSPAYLAVQFHVARLQGEAGQMEQARQSVDAILVARELKMPPSIRNQFLELRMRSAGNPKELLQYSIRHPAGVTDDNDPEISRDYSNDRPGRPITSIDFSGLDKNTPKVMFDRDFGDIWGRALPLSLSSSFVADASLPESMRKQLAMTTFTRAIVLKNDTVGKDAAAQLSLLVHEGERYMQDYRAATEVEETHFAGVFAVLHFPGMKPYLVTGLGRPTEFNRIDDYRDNWWCPLSGNVDFNEPAYLHEYRDSRSAIAKPAYPLFLTDEEKSQAAAEWAAVKTASPSANYLSREVLAWAQSHPDDPRVPEALHLAVRAARYGCNDEQTAHFTHACFRCLHQHYPNSQWAKKTPIWSSD